MRVNENRYPCLDLIKFIAAFIILAHHYYLNTHIQELVCFAHGGILVELFFMISGFLGAERRKRINGMSYKQYFTSVFLRFFPIVMFSVLVYGILGIIYYRMTGTWYRRAEINWWTLLNSLFLTFAGGAVGNIGIGVNNPIWYLCVLIICHTLLFAIQKFSSEKNFSVIYGYVCVIFLGVSAITYEISMPFVNPIVARGYYPFFIGGVISYINERRSFKGMYLPAAIVCFIYLLPYMLGWDFMYTNWKLSIPFILFPAIVILGTFQISHPVLLNVFKFLRVLSFDIYIWQGVVLLLQGIWHDCFMGDYSLTTFFCFILIVFSVSLVMHLIFDRRRKILL